MNKGAEPILSIGKRIRERRKLLGLKQKDIAKICNFASSQIASQIEKGERAIKAWELARIADLLKVDINFFFEKIKPSKPAPVFWRKEPLQDAKLQAAKFLQLCERYSRVEKLSGDEKKFPLPIKAELDWNTFSYRDVESFCLDEIAPILNLGSRPASSLVEVLEKRCGVKIIYQDLGKQMSAASAFGEFGPAILMNRLEAPWRRNFDFAHELFHLVTWSDELSNLIAKDNLLRDKTESYADKFAATLLLPEETLCRELKEKSDLAYMDVINLAREFEVSTSALLWRLVSIRYKNISKQTVEKVLSDREFRKLDKSTMHVNWWNPPDLPERFVRLAFLAYQKGNLSRMLLAEYLNTSLIDLAKTLAEYGFKEEEEAAYETKIDIA